jgi:F0F1-type ATP synthase assembly protein I
MENIKSLRDELDKMDSKLNESTEKLQDWREENSARIRSVFIIGCIVGSLITWLFIK